MIEVEDVASSDHASSSLFPEEVGFIRQLIDDLAVDGIISAIEVSRAIVNTRDYTRRLSASPLNDPDMMRMSLRDRKEEIAALQKEIEALRTLVANLELKIEIQNPDFGRF